MKLLERENYELVVEIKEKENDFDDMEKHIVCQSILLETYEKKNQILEENYKEMQLEYSGSFDYYKKKIEQLEENNKVQIENTNRYTKDIIVKKVEKLRLIC